jgi:hypothetical protein
VGDESPPAFGRSKHALHQTRVNRSGDLTDRAGRHHNPVVEAPIVGAHTTAQIDDAAASLDIELTDDEIQRLEGPYTARCDLQGINDDQAGLQRARVQ